jgi:hypothetical protein
MPGTGEQPYRSVKYCNLYSITTNQEAIRRDHRVEAKCNLAF